VQLELLDHVLHQVYAGPFREVPKTGERATGLVTVPARLSGPPGSGCYILFSGLFVGQRPERLSYRYGPGFSFQVWPEQSPGGPYRTSTETKFSDSMSKVWGIHNGWASGGRPGGKRMKVFGPGWENAVPGVERVDGHPDGLCMRCELPFHPGAVGVTLPFLGGPEDPKEVHYHRSCFMACLGLE
jgi:hypothetical protein